jgi:hypothetical protein
MEKLIYYCSICRGSVLVGETTTPRPERVGEKGPPAKLYCPHCEMLVVPLASSAAGEVSGDIHRTDARSENQGRSGGGNERRRQPAWRSLRPRRHAVASGSVGGRAQHLAG